MANLKLRIKAVAKEKGMTIAAVAEKLGIKPTSLSQGIYMTSFSLDKLGEIADILGVEVPELFESYVTPASNMSVEAHCPHCGGSIHLAIGITK